MLILLLLVLSFQDFLSFVAPNSVCLFAISPIMPTSCTSLTGKLLNYFLLAFSMPCDSNFSSSLSS